MTKLHNYNGRYCETEYENAFLSFLEEAGWNYLPGSSLPRTSMRDVLYIDDMEYFLNKTMQVRKVILRRSIKSMAGW